MSSYEIKRGDTLGKIAKAFGTTVSELARINKIANPDRIRAGTTIVTTDRPPVRDVERVMQQPKQEAKKGISFSLFPRAYAEDKPSPSDLYKIKKGDTLSKVAKTAGLSLAELRKLNPEIKDPRKIQVGQNVRLRTESTPVSGFFSRPTEKSEPIIPTNIKQLIKDVFGSEAPVTEDNLKTSELEALKQAVLTARKRGSTAIEYEDYGTQAEGESQYADVGGGGSMLGKIADPAYSMKTFIGQGGITQNEKGETIVLDRYNFNDAVDGNLFDFAKGAAEAGLSFYKQARNVGKFFGSAPGEGSPVAINLGKLSS